MPKAMKNKSSKSQGKSSGVNRRPQKDHGASEESIGSSFSNGNWNTAESDSERASPNAVRLQHEKGNDDREHREGTRGATSGDDQVAGNQSLPLAMRWWNLFTSWIKNLYTKIGPSYRPISVTVMSQSHESTVDELMKRLRAAQAKRLLPLGDIQFLQLPEHGLATFSFPQTIDVMVLCCSIKFRRFSITNVPDALYDDFLAHASRTVGREKIAVIVHDFYSEAPQVRRLRMQNFKTKQPRTFEAASLALICGDLGTKFEMAVEDWLKLEEFFMNAHNMLQLGPDNAQSAMETSQLYLL